MGEGMKFYPEGMAFLFHRSCMLQSTLGTAFSPAKLLGFDGRHDWRKLGRRFDFGTIDEFPTLPLSTIAQIQIFGQGIIVPVACIVNAAFPPDSARSVEIDKCSLVISAHLFDEKVRIQCKGLQPRQ